MKYFLAVLALFTALAMPAYAGDPPSDKDGPPANTVVHVGDAAPDFDLTTLDGKPLKLSEIGKGRTTVLIFWSFFCFPCQSEMPELETLYNEIKDSATLLAIALDGPEYDKFVLPFVAENKLTYPIAYDHINAAFYETADKYGVVGTPTIFVIDDTNRIRFINLGRLENSVLRQVVEGVKSKSFCADIVKPQVGDAPKTSANAQATDPAKTQK